MRAERRARRSAIAVACACAALLVAAVTAVVLGRSSGTSAAALAAPVGARAASGPEPTAIALHERLARTGLNVRAVQCVTPHEGASTYRGQAVLRCAANFGDPHMPVYCATRVARRLVTDRDVKALRC